MQAWKCNECENENEEGATECGCCGEPAPDNLEELAELKKFEGFLNYKGEPDVDWHGYTITNETSKLLSQIEKDSFEDRAIGSILGALIGDTTGSYLEFITQQPSEQELR